MTRLCCPLLMGFLILSSWASPALASVFQDEPDTHRVVGHVCDDRRGLYVTILRGDERLEGELTRHEYDGLLFGLTQTCNVVLE